MLSLKLLILGLFLNSSNIYANPISIPSKHCNSNKLDETGRIDVKLKNKLAGAKFTNMLIDLRFVVLHDGKKGKLTASQVQGQVEILNAAFGGLQHEKGPDSHMNFRVMEIKYVENKNYFYNCGDFEKEINKAYPGSTDKYVTIYTCEDKSYLGWAYYPWSWSEGNINQVVYSSPHTFPGGSYSSYNQGMTVVHELGHFFGLKHTFNSRGKCENWGDDGFSDTRKIAEL